MRLNLLLASASVVALISAGSAAWAQTQPIPPEHYTLDPRGVDLVTGSFNFGTTEVVIGQPGVGGLAYGRTFTNEGWRDNLVGGVSSAGGDMIVSVGPVSEAFVNNGSGWVSKYDNGSTVVYGLGTLTVTDRNGVIAEFDTLMGADPETNPYGASGGLIKSITTPTGEVTTFTYQTGSWCTVHCRPVHRLSAITNNRGYMLKYTYASDSPANNTTWFRLANVRGINLAVDWCDPTATSCTTFTQTWPSVTYGSFNAGGFPTTATDHAGRVTTYGYGGGGLTSVRHPSAVNDDIAVTYNASPDFRVNGVTDASGAWSYAYSLVGSVQTTTASGPLDQELVAEVDTAIGRATSVTNALGDEWSYQYDADLRVTRITQPEGDFVEYDYDTRSNVIATTWNPKPGTGLDPIVTSAQYPTLPCTDLEICNKPEWTKDALGGQTDYEWDEDTGQLVSVTLPAPSTGADRPQTRYAYDTFQARYHDSATTFTNGAAISLLVGTSACATGVAPACIGTAEEVVSSVAYPSTSTPNNLLPVSSSQGSGTTPAMATVAMTYTDQGDIRTVNGPLPGSADTITYVYNSTDVRSLRGVIGPDPDGSGPGLNRAQRFTYNGRGQVTAAETGTASGGSWANFSALLKLETIYDSAAYFRPVQTRQLSAAGAVASVRQVSYDVAGRADCVALRMNPAGFASPPASACTPDATGGFGPDRITQFAYDAAGRVLSTTTAVGTPDPLTESVSYTDNGQVASLTDARGNVTLFEYDGFDRLAKLRYPNATGGGTSTTDYEQYAFDDFGRPASFRSRAGAITSFTFDALNRLTDIDAPAGTPDVTREHDNLGRMTETGNGAIDVVTTYDALSRVLGETTTGLGQMAYEYDAAGRMTRIEWPDTFYVTYDHDLYGAVTAVREAKATSGPGVLATYVWNDLGLLSSVARAGGAGVSSSYGYDAWGRLTSLAHDASGSAEDLTLGYGYNPAGQIVSRTVSNDAYVWTGGTPATTYDRNGLNQVTEIDTSAATYDGNGNATSIAAAAYGYDAANRLTSADAGAGAATFAYDPASRLAVSSVGGFPTRFQYSGVQLVTEYDGAGNLVARHIPGLGLDDTAASWSLASTVPVRVWPITDERGSVVARGESTAVITHVNRYDEYGTPASGNSGRFQYTGQAWLAEAQAYHYRARTYFPQVGRFLQSDPLRYLAGPNLYAYVEGDPVNLVDPFGLQSATQLGEVVAEGERCPPGTRFKERREGVVICAVITSIRTGNPGLYPNTPPPEEGSPPSAGDGCYGPPPAPNTGTSQLELARQARANGDIAATHRGDPFGILWFRHIVPNNGPWDYKQYHRGYEDFGNYNYGYTGAALGLSQELLLRQAGRAQTAAGTTMPEWGSPGFYGLIGGRSPWGDDPRDAEMIRRGYQDRLNGCL